MAKTLEALQALIPNFILASKESLNERLCIDSLSSLGDPKEIMDALFAMVEVKNATVTDTGGSYPTSSSKSVIAQYERAVYLDSPDFSDEEVEEGEEGSIHATFEISYNMETGELLTATLSSGEFDLEVDYEETQAYMGCFYKGLRQYPIESKIRMYLFAEEGEHQLKQDFLIHPNRIEELKNEASNLAGVKIFSIDEAKARYAWNIKEDTVATIGQSNTVVPL